MNTFFKGGLAAAKAFSQLLSALAGPLSSSALTVATPSAVAIVPPNVQDDEITSIDTLHMPVGLGTPGADTADSNVVFAVPRAGGMVFVNAARLFAAFMIGPDGPSGLAACQCVVDAAPLIPANNDN